MVEGEVWMDLNGDQRIEPERDFLVTSGRGMFEDGGPDDQDSLQDGSFRQMIRHNWPLPIGFIFRAWENGVSDSAYLLQLPVSSRYSISGMVVNPVEKEGLLVYASLWGGAPLSGGMDLATLTDQNGDYRIWVPESLGARNWLVGSQDIMGVAPGYIPPVPLAVLVDGQITGVNLAYQEASAWVQGRVMAQDGEPIPQVRVSAKGEGGLSPATPSDSLGDYLLGVRAGRWTIGADGGDLIPDYLVPQRRRIWVDRGDKFPLDLVCFRANSTISGTVFTDRTRSSGIGVEGWCDFGWTRTTTDTAGVYLLRVASSGGGYSLRAVPPAGYYVEEGQLDGTLAGEQGANFHIRQAKASLQGKVYDQRGEGILGARVLAWGENGTFSTHTDQRGEYKMWLPEGAYTLQVQKEGYHTGTLQDLVVQDTVFTNDFRLGELPGLICGHIYGSNDTPLRSGWVTAYDSLAEDDFSTSTDWSGCYRLSVPFAALTLAAAASGYGEQWEEGIALTPSHPDTEVDIHLSPSGVAGKKRWFLPPLLSPNPFNRETDIRFLLRGRGEREVKVGVYNLRGEMTKLIFSGQLLPGPYRFVWKGRVEGGGLAKSGLYFLRLDVDGEEEIKKMFLIR